MKFQVFKNGKVVENFRLCGAYLLGTDGISIRRARIAFDNGFIECGKPNLETAGLALLWPVDGFGRVLLSTTCLPERQRPYNLNLEIARARLMQIVNKREEWFFFNSIEGLEDVSKEAQDLFIEALQTISDTSRASDLADRSLKLAMSFSEELAARQAETLFRARAKSRSFGRGCIGCKVDPVRIGEPRYVGRILELFDFVTIPIDWAQIEAHRGEFDFSRIDSCIEALGGKKLVLGAGPLLRFTKENLPKWLLKSSAGFEKIRETVYQFISRIVGRYTGTIHRWFVISGLNAFNHFGFSFEQIVEMTRAVNMAVKAASPRAQKIIEVSNPWGEYYATTPRSIPPLAYMDMVVQSGINFDAFGLQMLFGKNQSGMHIRDMLQISAILDYLSPVAKPLYVTDVAIPSRNGEGLYDGKVAGVWRQEWDEYRQAQWLQKLCTIAMSKPFVEAIEYASLADGQDATIANSGLLTDELEPKESFRALGRLRGGIFNK